MFGPVMIALAWLPQSSTGSGSAVMEPVASVSPTALTPCVLPEIRLIAPGVDGPYVVSKKLSLIAKCWA